MTPEVLKIPLKDVDLNDTYFYKALDEVFVGVKAQKYLHDNDLSNMETKNFQRS